MTENAAYRELMSTPIIDLFFEIPVEERRALFDKAFSGMNAQETNERYMAWAEAKAKEAGLAPGQDQSDHVKAMGNFMPTMSYERFRDYIDWDADIGDDESDDIWYPLKPGTSPQIQNEYEKTMRYNDMMNALGIIID